MLSSPVASTSIERMKASHRLQVLTVSTSNQLLALADYAHEETSKALLSINALADLYRSQFPDLPAPSLSQSLPSPLMRVQA